MCKVTKEASGANKIMRNAIYSTSVTFRWTSCSSRQSVFSTTYYDRPENRRKWQPVAEEWLFGQNWAMDVRSFAGIKTVIWDQLRLKLSRVKLYFRFVCETPQGRYIIGQGSLFRWFPLCVVRSPPRLCFRLNHSRIVRKRCPHSTFSSQGPRTLTRASYRCNKSDVIYE